MQHRHRSVYDFSIRSLPVIFMAGIGVALVGAYLRSRPVIDVGTGVFLLGGAIWGLVNGGFLLALFAQAARKLGIRGFAADVAANPLKTALFVVVAVFLAAAGVGLSWAACRALFAR